MSAFTLWSAKGAEIDEEIQAFLAGEDLRLDREWLLEDLRASQVHAACLVRAGVLSAEEGERLSRELERLSEEWRAGRLELDPRLEDGHSAIEYWLSERLGELGRKIHAGRSRNDQILVATRLWLKARLSELASACRGLAAVALARAEQEASSLMPGYTHLQPAVVQTLGHWWAGYAEAFIDDAWRARQTREYLDANPLGSAAGYGVNLPLDRDFATAALGFARLQLNPHYCQLSRGKFEVAALEALAQALLDLRRMAWDLSLFSTREFGFLELPARWTTGSSLMPNKRNPDAIELLRASYGVVAGAKAEIEAVLSLPSGYHRDLQAIKAPLVRAFARGLSSLRLLARLAGELGWRRERLAEAVQDPALGATDRAIALAQSGKPFRDAYREVKADPAGGTWDPEASVAARISPGAPGRLELARLAARLAALREGEGG
jgi:argininosuccinate lyase